MLTHDARVPVPCPREVPVCLEPSRIAVCMGCTPLIPLRQASAETGAIILAKAEYLNPGGSIKDRIASFIVSEAERRGDLRPGMTIYEVTSGNTGIALSMIGAMRGYKVIIELPRTVSEERRKMMEAFGAEVRLFEELLHIQDAIARTIRMAAEDKTLFLPSQFSNPDNPLCHEKTTGTEIIEQTHGRLDAFVMGVGTGGTLMGVGRALRRENIKARVVAVEPEESAVMSGRVPRHHGIQGLADGFIPEVVKMDEIDDVLTVPTEAAREMAARLAREEGLLVGISSGANVIGAMEMARRLGAGSRIVTALPDRGERYLSLK